MQGQTVGGQVGSIGFICSGDEEKKKKLEKQCLSTGVGNYFACRGHSGF